MNQWYLRSKPTFVYICFNAQIRLQKTVTCVVRILRTFEVQPTLVNHHNAEMSPPTVEDAGPETLRITVHIARSMLHMPSRVPTVTQ